MGKSRRWSACSSVKFGHEIDRFGRDELRRQGQIALVLTVFVIDNNHHASGANLGQCARNIGKGGLEGAGSIWHGNLSIIPLVAFGGAAAGAHESH